MRYPKEKYQIVVHQHPTKLTTEIIAISSYAGKAVRGKAICHSEDTYDEQKGIDLAIARCAAKIAEKRAARARKCYQVAQSKVLEAEAYLNKMQDYVTDAETEVASTGDAVHKLLDDM